MRFRSSDELAAVDRMDEKPHVLDGRLHVRLAEEVAAGDEHVGAGLRRRDGGLDVDAAVDHDVELRLLRPDRRDLGHAVGDERLPAVARMHRHHQHFVDLVQIRDDALDRRLGVEDDCVPEPERTDAPELVVQVAVGLDVNLQSLRTGLDERFQIKVRTRHHEVDVAVEAGRGAPRERDNIGPEREVRHEVRVHDVEVQGLGARRLGPQDLVGETTEVRREQRR